MDDRRSDASTQFMDDCRLLGVRGLMKKFSVAMVLMQQNFVPGQKGAGWDLLAADCEIKDFQVRVFSFGDNILDDSFDGSMASSASSLSDAVEAHLDFDENAEARSEWSMNCGDGAMYFQDDSQMEPCCWVPRLVYHQKGSDSVFPLYIPGFQVPNRDEKIMQQFMLNKRLGELSVIIDRHNKTVKRWEDRIAVYNDEVLVGVSIYCE